MNILWTSMRRGVWLSEPRLQEYKLSREAVLGACDDGNRGRTVALMHRMRVGGDRWTDAAS